MRINLYHHEMKFMAERVEHIRKTADTGIEFHGIRFYTEAPLMHQPDDDDSSAVTFWVPWTKKSGHNVAQLRRIALNMIQICDSIEGEANGPA